ncbi:MAG: glycoside hydrolase family 3 protein, partial [Micromonospora sp.]
LAAARRAVRVVVDPSVRTRVLPLGRPAHVVEFAPPRNLAIGPETPWGIAGPLTDLLPGTTTARYAEDDVPADPTTGAAGRPVVLVVRDLHRYDWMRAAVARALAVRPDAVVVELGVPELVTGAVHVATHGATRAAARAAAELLTGAR